MHDDSFSLKARRTTRIPLRIPILLAFRESATEKEKTLDAWTLIVNVNGARVECKHLFEMSQEVVIRIPHLGKSQKGTIVWRDTNANKSGGYECGIKLEKAENLWGVGFPPSDWTTKASGIDDLLPNKPVPELEAKTSSEAAASAASQASPETFQVLPTEPTAPMPEALPVPLDPVLPAEAPAQVDLTADLPGLGSAPGSGATLALFAREAAEEPANAPHGGISLLEAGAAFPALPVPPSATPRTGIGQEALLSTFPTTPADPARTPSDRLSTIFHELVESALQQRLHGLVEGLAARMGERVREIQSEAIAEVERQVASVVTSRTELLEHRAAEVAASRQAALEGEVQRYLASQEEAARGRQEALVEEAFRTMGEGMAQTTTATSERLQQQAEEIALTARTNLWQNVQQELPAIERNVFARSRAQADQAVSACLDEMNQQLPRRVQQAEQSAKQRLDSLVEEKLSEFTLGLTARAEQLQAESRARIEQQVQEVWKQASQAFLRHIVSELNQKKRSWIEEAEGSLKELATQNLRTTRRNMTGLLKDLGTSLLDQACKAEAGTAAAAEAEREAHEITRLVEANIAE